MVQTVFRAYDTYLTYAEDTAFGTPGVPDGSLVIGKVQSFLANMNNNIIPTQGIGDGRNATNYVNGIFTLDGSIDFQVAELDFLQYGFGAEKSGAGTVGDPFELQEVNAIGYSAGEMPTLTLEVGSDGSGGTNDVMAFDGVAINSMNLDLTQGQIMTCSMGWVGRSPVSSTAIETYVPGSVKLFTFVDGQLKIGANAILEVVSAKLSVTSSITTYPTIDSRFIKCPLFGTRRYNFTITVKMTADDGAGELSYQDLRGLFLNGSTGTTPADTSKFASLGTISLILTEGAVAGDRTLNFDLENTQFQTVGEAVDLGAGVREVTINGFGLAGLSDSTNKVPLRWTVAT